MKSEVLGPEFAEGMRTKFDDRGISSKRKEECRKAWMDKFAKMEYSGFILDRSVTSVCVILPLKAIHDKQRSTAECAVKQLV